MSTSSSSSTTITVSQFKVDLQQLADAITQAQTSQDNITGWVGQVITNLNAVAAEWSSPGYQTWAALVPQATGDMNQLVTLMGEMVTRMQAAYTQYSSIELTNVQSLTFS